MKKPKKFWMLSADNGGAPNVRHEDYMSAVAEAKRLVELKEKITKVYILEAVGVINVEVIKNMTHEEIKYDKTSDVGLRNVLRPEDFQPVKDDNGELHS